MSDREKVRKWNVGFSSTAARQKKKLPENVIELLALLVGDLEQTGPIQKIGLILAL